MFSEVLKIIPKLDGAALASMESSLSRRFAGLAKKFGSGLKAAILGGGVTALAVSVIDKLLNPLKETQEAVDRLLGRADDISTFAKQFGTTSGNLFKLQQLAGARGLDAEGLNTLLLKFQTAVTAAKANPDQPSSVSNFVNESDLAEGFYKFIQSLQKLTRAQQDFVQRDVFGERQILKASEFLNTPSFKELENQVGISGGTGGFTQKIEKGAALQDLKQILSRRTDTAAFNAELDKLKPGMVQLQNVQDQLNAAQEIKNLGAFDDLKKLSIAADRIQKRLEDAFTLIVKHVPQIAEALTSLAGSRVVRGAVKGKVGK